MMERESEFQPTENKYYDFASIPNYPYPHLGQPVECSTSVGSVYYRMRGEPDTQPPKGVVFVVGGRASWTDEGLDRQAYRNLTELLAQQGYLVITYLFGEDLVTKDVSTSQDNMYEVVADIENQHQEVLRTMPNLPISFVATSQGVPMALLAAANMGDNEEVNIVLNVPAVQVQKGEVPDEALPNYESIPDAALLIEKMKHRIKRLLMVYAKKDEYFPELASERLRQELEQRIPEAQLKVFYSETPQYAHLLTGIMTFMNPEELFKAIGILEEDTSSPDQTS